MSSSPVCSARYATPLTGRPNLAGSIVRTAAELGTVLMPHHEQIAATATELEGGKLVYRQAAILLARLPGDFALALAVAAAAMPARPLPRVVVSGPTRRPA